MNDVLAALLPPVGLLPNEPPFSAILNLMLIVNCVIFGPVFNILAIGAVGARNHRPAYQAAGAPASASGRGDPPAWPCGGLSAQNASF